MPIVFVHGVNNRRSDSYRESEAARNGFLRELVAPVFGLLPGDVRIFSPYWGGAAVKFACNMAVLPDAEDEYEHFGSNEQADVLNRTVELVGDYPEGDGIVEGARRDFATTVAVAASKERDRIRTP
jgi:hypothetical protein